MLPQRHFFLCLLATLVFSCNSPTNSTDKNAELSTNLATNVVETKKNVQNEAPQSSRNSSDIDKKLLDAFTEEQLNELKSVEKLFSNIKTAEDLAKFYQNTLPKVVAVMNKKINQYDPENGNNDLSPDKWAWFNDYMPYISVEKFCSECETQTYIVVNPLRDKAELTNSKEDDLFLDALLVTYGNEINKDKVCDKKPNNWIKLVNCDLCGADILGSEKYLNTLTAVEKAQKLGKLFDAELVELNKQALPRQATNYYLPKEIVLKELESIINLTSLNAKNKENLKNMRYLINVGKDIQFDCQKGNCQFLAM